MARRGGKIERRVFLRVKRLMGAGWSGRKGEIRVGREKKNAGDANAEYTKNVERCGIDSFPAGRSQLSLHAVFGRGPNRGVGVRNAHQRGSSGEGEFRRMFFKWCPQSRNRDLCRAERNGWKP